MWEIGGIALLTADVSTRWSFMLRPIYSWHPLHSWLCGPYSQSGSFGIYYLLFLIEIFLVSEFRTPKKFLAYRLWEAYQWLY